MGEAGEPLDPRHPFHMIKAHPTGPTSPEMWILGSSDYGAQLAAHLEVEGHEGVGAELVGDAAHDLLGIQRVQGARSEVEDHAPDVAADSLQLAHDRGSCLEGRALNAAEEHLAVVRALERQEEMLKQVSKSAIERDGTSMTASGN